MPDCRGDPRLRYPQHAATYGLVSYLGLPVQCKGRLFGVLAFNTTAPRAYRDDEVVFLFAFARQAALAIENARMHEATVHRAQQLGTLTELTRLLTTVLDPERVAQEILAAAQVLVPGAAGRFWAQVGEGDAIRLVASVGLREPEGRFQRLFSLGEGLAGIAAATRQPVISPDVTSDSRFINQDWARAERLVSGIVLPLIHGDRIHGLLAMFTRTPHTFTEEEIGLLRSFAAQAAVALENARLYEAVQRHAVGLEARVQERTAELEEALRVKSEFLANMSHELRTPLNAIIGFCELLRDPTFGPLTEKQTRFLGNIHKGGQHLLALFNDLLDLSAVEAGRLHLHPEPLELRIVLDSILHDLHAQADGKGLTLDLHVDPTLGMLNADPVRFKQILYNLLSNAVKFTPEGGRITVTARRVAGLPSSVSRQGEPLPTEDRRPGTTDGFLEISVADTGIGIKAEDLAKLFRPLTQLEPVLTKRYQGTGLGLALTKRLVELHGGRVWAESEGEGRGSTFTFVLPPAGPKR
ncbi:MAG: GAF domain-containing protein [candidate division NC10 bacterium]|nr:GAF domain-containing protein [candidate division NC10 bacterium]